MTKEYLELITEGKAFLESNNSIKAFFPLEKAYNLTDEHDDELITLLIESSYKGIWGAYGADQYELMEYLSRFSIHLLQDYSQLVDNKDQILKLAKAHNGLAMAMFHLGKRSVEYNRKSREYYDSILSLLDKLEEKKTVKDIVKSKIKNDFGIIINRGFDDYFDEALELSDDAIELAREYKLVIEEGLALKIKGNLLNYKSIRDESEDFDESFKYLSLAEQCFKSLKSKEALKRLSELYLLICDNYYKLEDYPSGSKYLNLAEDLFDRLNSYPVQYYILKAKELEHDKGLEPSLDFYLKAIQLLNISKWGVQFETNIDSFLKHKDKEEIYLKVISIYIQKNEIRSAFELLENFRSKLFVENILTGKRNNLGQIPESLAKERESVIKKLEKQYSVELESWDNDEISRLEKELYYCDEKIASIKGSYRAFTEYQTDGFEDIKLSISIDTLILEFFYYGESFSIFLVTRDKIDIIKIDFNSSDLEDLIENYLKLIKTEYLNPDWNLIEDFYKSTLSSLIISPIEEYFRKFNKLILIPYKVLHSFPLHYLFFEFNEALEISYLPNLQSIKILKQDSISKEDGAFFYGDPRNNLPGAKEEIETISKLFNNKEVLTGNQCEKANLIEGLEKSKLGHYSGHIRYNSKKPLYSYLECSDHLEKKKKKKISTIADNQSVLYLKEIYQLNLENTDFLCLSGCSSGKATTYLGEETVGMVRGFFYTGLQSILASFWDIEDESSKDFLILFFEKTFECGGNKKKGFQKALIEMKKKYQHPFFYGGFALYEGI